MRHGSLFSGIGGFDLAAEWMGWENVFHCEWNEFGQKVLKYYWPNAISYGNITKTYFTIHRGRIDILTGGFPCQPFSTAGKRKGTADDRYLWPEMLRAIREIQPKWIVGENVPGIVSWSGGLVFEHVCADLEAEGYEVQPVILPAAGVNAPHKRDRVWFIAYSKDIGHEQPRAEFNDCDKSITTVTSDSKSKRQQSEQARAEIIRTSFESEVYGRSCIERSQCWTEFPTQSPICSRNDGLSSKLVGITFPKHRNESIKAYGNAIVPQVAFQIFKAIEAIKISTNGNKKN